MSQYGAKDFVVATEWKTFATSFSSYRRFVGASEWQTNSHQLIAAELRKVRSSMDWTSDPMIGVAALVWKPAGDGEYFLIERGFPMVAQYSAFSMPPNELRTLEQKSGVTSVGFAGHHAFVWLPHFRWIGLLANMAICGGVAWLMFASPVWIWKGCKRHFRRKAGACVECGYSLIGQAPKAVCPECGHGSRGNH